MKDRIWKDFWGADYNTGCPLKDTCILVLRNLEQENKIGPFVLDVGSGSNGVVKNLRDKHKVIALDIAAPKNQEEDNYKYIKFDIEDISRTSRISYKKALIEASQFLNIDRKTANKEQIDSIIFSEILNYIDYRKVLAELKKYLKPGGRFMIMNQPSRGITALFSKRGLKNNKRLYQFLESQGFNIEQKIFPTAQEKSRSEDKEFLMLVAVKS